MITLTRGDWRLCLRPELGGAVTHLTHRGRDILRPTPDTADGPLQSACFPLVPYANRVLGGRFVFEGREVILPTLPAFSPHALHGEGWLAQWSVAETADDHAVLTFDNASGDWPWPYSAEQRFSVDDAGLRMELSVRNTADVRAPMGLGLHPYFLRGADTRLTLAGDGVWSPLSPGAPWRDFAADDPMDWSRGREVNDAPFIDHTYGGWDGIARIDHGDHAVLVRASSSAPFAHVFTPTGEDFLCVEAVTHRPDALNGEPEAHGAMTVLSPGEMLSMWMTVGVETV